MRRTFLVTIDLDPTAGSMHTDSSAQANIFGALDNVMGHYNVEVTLAPDELQPATDVTIEFDEIQFGEKPEGTEYTDPEKKAWTEVANAGSFAWDLSQMNRPYYEVSECIDAGSTFRCMGDVFEWVIFPDETARYRLCENHCAHRRGRVGAFGVRADGAGYRAIHGENTHDWVKDLETRFQCARERQF